MVRRFGILLCLLILGSTALTQSQYLPFRNYSIEVGLSESVAHTLIQDEKGYIWVGTGYGLNRFDGRSFRQYYEENGLASNVVHSLYQDDGGDIWVGTETGISILKGDTLTTPESVELLSQFPILAIHQDDMGRYWFGTESDGVWRLETNGDLISLNEQMSVNLVRVQAIFEGIDGSIWLGSRQGAIKIKDGAYTYFSTSNGLPDNRIRHFSQDSLGRMWIATRAGLVKYDDGEINVYDQNEGLLDPKVYTISIEHHNKIWLGTESGVSVFDGETFQNYTREDGVPATIVYSSMIDHEGNIWFGTLGGGISIFVGDYFQSFDIENGLTNNVIVGFAEDSAGKIWIATYGGGVQIYDGTGFDLIDESDGLIDDKVYTFLMDSRDRVWVGTREGISIYENGEMRTLTNEEFPFEVVRKIYEDEDKNEFWVATYEDGLIRIQEDGFIQYNIDNVLQNDTVMDIKEDEDGYLWFATYGGAVRYDGNEFKNYTIADGLPSNGVIHIYIDHNGDKWFSTFNGVARFDGEQFQRFTQSEQVDLISYFVIQDRQHRYWVGTNRGLYHMEPDRIFEADDRLDILQSFRIYNTKQGLITNELNAGGSMLASDGTIWLGTVEGLSHFFPDRLREIPSPPGIEFEEVMVSGRMVNPDREYVFNHDENFVQLAYKGLSYEAPDQIFYQYRMRGLEQGWQITRERVLRYPSLSPGEYEFQLRAYNADGEMSTKTADFSFEILYPFYFRWWFIGLMVFLGIGILLFSIRFYRIKKQVDIERMRVQIASDLHDDVGSSLTELALQTDFLQAGDVSSEVKSTLKQLGQHSRRIVSSLDDIVWSIDSRNDTAGDLTDRMQDYVNQVFVNGEVKVFYDFEDLRMHEKLPVDVKENVYLIFKEAVNNIVKHSNATRVNIRFAFSGNQFLLEIKDNGTKISSDRKSGQGLRNIRYRAERIGANVSFDTEGGFTVCTEGTIK